MARKDKNSDPSADDPSQAAVQTEIGPLPAHPIVDKGPRGKLCKLLNLKDPANFELFMAAGAEIEKLRVQLDKMPGVGG